MKKIFAVILTGAIILSILVSASIFMAGCESNIGYNAQIFDGNYKFNYAFILFPDGKTIEGEVKSWLDYDDSDMVRVTFTDNNVYYTHGSNVILIYDPNL